MAAQILAGKELAAKLKANLADKIKTYGAARAPGLAVIMVGNDPASAIYVRNKRLACTEVGINSTAYDLNASTSETELLALITSLNHNPAIDGILLQLPLPAHINSSTVITAIAPEKDVDSFHPINLGMLAQNRAYLRPCTPKGIMLLLATIPSLVNNAHINRRVSDHYTIDSQGNSQSNLANTDTSTSQPNINLAGMNAIVIGTSNIVGKPMLLELINARATVTICNSKTRNLAEKVKAADLVVSATGSPGLIASDWIKPGSIVIDVGISRLASGKLAGDIDYARALDVAGWITPVPGGVGPMTIAALLDNTWLAYTRKLKLKT